MAFRTATDEEKSIIVEGDVSKDTSFRSPSKSIRGSQRPASSASSNDESKSQKDGLLKAGDIVFLKCTIPTETSSFQALLSADGVLSTYVESIPKVSERAMVKGANVLTRSCMFRIEAARTVVRKDDETDDPEYNRVLGKAFAYGELVQFRHFHSRGFLGVHSSEIALEQGCLRVGITHETNEFTWFQVLPVNKLRRAGEKIKFSDAIFLRVVGLQTNYFLHTLSQARSSSEKLEVNCSPEQWEWKPRRYMDFDDAHDKRYLTTSAAFRIYHRIAEGYLVATEVPLLASEAKEPIVFVSKENRSSSSLWELQRTATFIGGRASWSDRFRVKHLATGLFLCNSGVLVPDSNGPEVQFVLEPDTEDASRFISYGSILCFQSVASGEYMNVPTQDSHHISKFKQNEPASDPNALISWVKDKKNFPKLAFCVEEVPISQTDHVYKLALMTPAVIDFYSYVDIVTNADNLKVAGGYARIIDECKEMETVLGNISAQIIHKSDIVVDIVKRQDSMREMGIIDALLELGKAIEVLTSNLHMQKFSSSRMNVDDRDAIVKACFEPVEKRLFKVLHESIKGNEKSCIRIHQYEDYLMAKMHVPEVGQLLKEVFKFTRTHENVDEARFDRWFRRPDRPDADLSIEEMILNLHIIASLCESTGRGVAKYQMMTHRYLMEAKNEFPLMKFLYISKKPSIDLVFKSEKHAQVFLDRDPQFKDFEPAKLRQTLSNKASGQCCFYLEDLCRIPIVVKFLTAELMLLANVCLDRNSKMINVVTKELTFSVEHSESVLQSMFLPDKIRAAYARLYRVVFLDVDPYYSCREDLSRCYQFEEGMLVKAQAKFKDKQDGDFEGICRIVRRFWYYDGMISMDGQHLGQKLELTASFLRLTRALVELGMDIGEEKHKFIEILLQPLSLLLMERIPSTQSELMKHWCCKLMLEVRDSRRSSFKISLESKWSKVIYEVLLILEVVLKHKQDLHINLFLGKFKQVLLEKNEEVDWKETFPVLKEDFAVMLQKLDFDIKFKGQHSEGGGAEDETLMFAEAEEGNEGTLALDLYLLHLVFNLGKSRNKKIRKKALDIVIQNMNEKKRLKEQLEEVQFLIGAQMTTYFSSMLETRKKLRSQVQIIEEDKWLEEDLKDLDRETKAIEHLVREITELVKQLTVPEESKFMRTKLQDIMRQSSLHTELINILYVDYDLGKHSVLFEKTFDALRLFILNNKKNQSLMFDHKDRLLSLMEFQEGGVTHLLTEVLRSYRDTEFGLEVIKYLFVLIERHDEYPYKLLQLLRTFTVDESGVYIKNIQIDILKGIVSSVKVANLHQQKNGTIIYTLPVYDRGGPQASLINRFHLEVIRTLISCTHNNRFGLLQCRKLISMNTLKNAVRQDKNTTLTCKKTYLRYLYQVYMTSLEPDVVALITVNDIEEVLRDVQHDLEDYSRRIVDLVKIATTGTYDNVRLRVSEFRPKSLYHEFGTTDEDERGSLEFWNYLSGKETIHTEKDGLLHIIRDMFGSPGAESMTDEVTSVAFDISKHLKGLSRDIAEQEEVNKNLDFSNFQLILNACREVLPKASGDIGGSRVRSSLPLSEDNSDTEEGEEFSKLVAIIREYVLSKNITFEQAFDLFDVNRDGSITIAELKGVLRSLMQGTVREVELDRAVRFLDADGDGSIQFDEFTNKLKKAFSKTKKVKAKFKDINLALLPQLKENLTEEQEKDQKYKESLLQFNEEFARHFTDVDIQPLILKVYNEFLEPAFTTKDYSVFSEFISKLSTAFTNRAHKMYLIHMLRLLVLSHPGEETETIEVKNEKMKKAQTALCGAGTLEMTLHFLTDASDTELINESIELMLALLKGGNFEVQKLLLSILKKETDAHLFSYIRSQLRLSRDRIVTRATKLYELDPVLAASEMVSEVDIHAEEGVCEKPSPEELQQCQHVTNLLYLIQNCCENCFTEFQHFFRTQTDDTSSNRQVSIALVSELAQYLINLKEVGRQLRNDFEAAQVVPLCLQTLIEICKGPCLENQQQLGTKKKLYKFINFYITIDLTKTFNIDNFGPGNSLSPRSVAEARFFVGAIKLLKALLEGEFDVKVAEMMLSVINFKSLAGKATDIYEHFVQSRWRLFMQDRYENEIAPSPLMRFLHKFSDSTQKLTPQEKEIIDLGFDICIITLKLRQKFPNEDLKWLEFSDRVPRSNSTLDKSFFLNRIEAFDIRSESVFADIVYLYHEFRDFLRQREDRYSTSDLAYSFYLSLIGTVEIDRGGTLTRCYFRFPTMLSFISSKIKSVLLVDVNRNSHDEKIKSFFEKSKKYEVSMEHLQQLSRVRLLATLASKRPFLGKVCYLMIVALNFILLYNLSSASDATSGIGSIGSTAFLTVFAIILSLLALTVYLLYIVENYPIIVYDREHQARNAGAYKNKSLSKLKGTVLMKEIAQRSREIYFNKTLPRWKKVLSVMVYHENIYHLAYVIISFVALNNPLFYSILLLDIIRRSDHLMRLVNTVLANWRQLLVMLILSLMIVFLFSVGGFLWFGEYYELEGASAIRSTSCHSLLQCFGSVLDEGVRAGGGIGDVLGFADISNSEYWYREVFDLVFFLTICTLAFDILLGIIIDSFAQIRDQKKFVETDMKTVCFICGRHLYEFEFKGSGWNEHIQMEHNLYAYLSFIIYIRRRPLSECDGLEKYVKQKISDQDVSFFPKTAISILAKDTSDELDASLPLP